MNKGPAGSSRAFGLCLEGSGAGGFSARFNGEPGERVTGCSRDGAEARDWLSFCNRPQPAGAEG